MLLYMIVDITTGARLLEAWHVIAFPTETVYGLWANAFNIKAVQSIFDIKQRPQDNPLIVHVANLQDIHHIALVQSDIEQDIINKRMPWPLTLLLHNKSIPDIVRAWHDRVGIRIPDHSIARQCIAASWVPICAPSANISWRPSATTVSMVHWYFGNNMPIIDGWDCQVGIESTVVWVVDGSIIIYRPGIITAAMISQTRQWRIPVHIAISDTDVSPGTRYRHYAPQCQILLLPSNVEHMQDNINQQQKVWLLVMDDYIITYPRLQYYRDYCTIISWGCDYKQAANRLYKAYQYADQLWLDILYVQQLDDIDIWLSIMNRVRKSIE